MKPPVNMPLPWSVCASNGNYCSIWDEHSNRFQEYEDMEQAAAYIQHCVNNYPALVEALRLIKDAGQTAPEVIAEEALRKAGEI